MDERIEIRIHGDATLSTLIYLPGLHGDWTLITGLRNDLAGHVRFVELMYPRTNTWSLEDYADAISAKLMEHDLTRGWLLGESFGSQIVWQLLAKTNSNSGQTGTWQVEFFRPTGVILAGGFVRYPFPTALKFMQIWFERLPTWAIRSSFCAYAVCVRLPQCIKPEIFESVREFVSRRTQKDVAAMAHRLKLMRSNDPSPAASKTSIPARLAQADCVQHGD